MTVEGSEAVVSKLVAALQQAGAADVTAEPLEEQDWDEVWRRHFKPRRIGKRFVIRPTWESFESGPTDLEIVLDPGQAFGTGDHPTTRLCLQLLDESLVNTDARVADVGCGSGILSIAAKKIGAEVVQGVDIEALSVEVARENAELNQVDCRFVEGDSISALQGDFDLVLSNIISAILIVMAPAFRARLKDGGMWIASGIIEPNWPDVEAAAIRNGFEVAQVLKEDGWVAALLKVAEGH